MDYAARLDRARTLMGERSIDLLLLSVGADLPYFSGYSAPQLERLTMLVVPADGPATLVVPRLEAPRVEVPGDAFAVRPWDETEDPVEIVVDLAGTPGRALVGDNTWSVFLLSLQEAMPATGFAPASPLTRELRMRKEPAEIDLLRAAGAAADRVAVRLATTRFSGLTERQLAAKVEAMAVEEGHDHAWSAIVAAGPNGASPHHEPGGRPIVEGDAVVVDFGGTVGGYHSDTTRTFAVGPPREPVAAAHAVLEEAQAAARSAVRSGVTAESIDAAARQVIDAAGLGERFIHRTGHGIGLEVHEHPYIVAGNRIPLEPGMAFSIEPGIYVPGEFGLRIEDIVVCTADGIDELNRSPRGLVVAE